MKLKGRIYIIKNTINDKVYIRQTTMTIKERFMSHKKPSVLKQRGSYKLYNAMNKYGVEKFYCELICETENLDELDDLEIYYISKYNSYENGYNSTCGGDTKHINKIQDIQLLVKLYNENHTYEQIGNRFGVHKETVKRTLNSLGYNRKPKIISEDDLHKYKHLTNIEIAKILNVSTATITRYFKKYNIKRGTGCSNHLNRANQLQLKDVLSEEFLKENINVPNSKIAKEVGVSSTTVQKYFEIYGLKTKKHK